MSDATRVEDSTLAVPKTARAPEQRRFTLEVSAGADRGLKFSFDASEAAQAPRLLCGTSQICGLQLSDRTISRRHLAIELNGPSLRLTDLDSLNGTFVNGVRVGEAFLFGGEAVQLGETTLSVSAATGDAAEPQLATPLGRFLGESEPIRRMKPLFERWAQSAVPLLIEGETGTGKELLAEVLHEVGPRTRGPFVVFDCAAATSQDAELALFGLAAGASQTAASVGAFEQARGGTLLFDEIAELEPALQAKLLRVLEHGEFRPFASPRAQRADTRCMFTTRRDLDKEVQAGRFREDLFLAISVARVELPPLRRRFGDIPLLARHFWQSAGGEPDALEWGYVHALDSYPWPGNVRELKDAVVRKLTPSALQQASAVGEQSRSSHPPSPPSSTEPDHGSGDWLDLILAQRLPLPMARRQVLDTFLRRYVTRILADHGGNVSHAAAASGLARRYFQLIKARQR